MPMPLLVNECVQCGTNIDTPYANECKVFCPCPWVPVPVSARAGARPVSARACVISAGWQCWGVVNSVCEQLT